MKRYIYSNATVYITEPTDEQMATMRKATEHFLRKVIKEQIKDESRTNHKRLTRNNCDSGSRT